MSQKYVAYMDAGNIFTYWDDGFSPPPDPLPPGQHALPITDEQYYAVIASSPLPYTVVDAVLTAPSQAEIDAYFALLAWNGFQSTALNALAKSDITVLRCYEHAIPVPAEWGAYRDALRTIVSAPTGDPTAGLPSHPAYPAGS